MVTILVAFITNENWHYRIFTPPTRLEKKLLNPNWVATYHLTEKA